MTSRKRVITLGGDARIMSGFGIISKLDYYEISYKGSTGGTLTRANYQAGIAFRPEKHDFLNILGKCVYVSDHNTHAYPVVRNDRLITSIHAYLQLHKKLGIGSRLAMRSVLDEEGDYYSDTTQTWFGNINAEISWNLRWSTIIDVRYLHMISTKERATGLAMEMDYLLIENTQLGIGYLLNDFADEDFSFSNYQYRNIYLSLHIKFSEDIFNWR